MIVEYYYFNLQRSTSANTSTRKFSYYASNTYLPVVPIQGELVAIDAKNSKYGLENGQLTFPSVLLLYHATL